MPHGGVSSTPARSSSSITSHASIPLPSSGRPVTSILYVGSIDNADLSPINTATCNSLSTAGCPGLPPEIVVGSEPTALALDADNHTIYVSNNGDGTLSLVATGP